LLGFTLLNTTMDFLLKLFSHVIPLDKKMFFPMTDILGIHGIKIAFGHGQVINGIQKIGFTGPIIPNETVDLLAERQLKLIIILEIYQGK